MAKANLKVTSDGAQSHINLNALSIAPTAPLAGDLYLDDGTNTASTNAGWRRFNGSTWDDVSASSGGGSSLPVDDTTSLVQDPADNTKEMRIDVGGVTTGTVRVATMPDADLTIVGTDTAQTLTNKTIDADGTGNTITNIGSSEVKSELITGLTADSSPDEATDYIMSYDASATALKKVLLETILGVDCGVRTYSSTVQAMGTIEKISFDLEYKDTHGFHDNSTNPERHTVPTGYGGTYIISGHVRLEDNTTGVRRLDIMVNDEPIAGMQIDSTGSDVISVSTVYDLVATDYVELELTQLSGGDLDTVIVSNYSPEFRMQRIPYYYG